jgi:hypothetical protein
MNNTNTNHENQIPFREKFQMWAFLLGIALGVFWLGYMAGQMRSMQLKREVSRNLTECSNTLQTTVFEMERLQGELEYLYCARRGECND